MKEVVSMFQTIVKFKKLMIGLILSALLLSGMNYGYSQSYYQEEDIVIALDAGHYIGEPGKRSPYDSFWDTQKLEVQYNLSIVRLVEAKLKEQRPDIKIYLTNPYGTNNTRSARAVDCEKHNVDVIFSVHMNAIGDEWQEKITGACICVNKEADRWTKDMAQDFVDDYSKQTGIKKTCTDGIYERGSEVGLLHKATQLGISAILIECDFMDNYEVYRNFSDPTYLDMISDVITENIIRAVDNGNF